MKPLGGLKSLTRMLFRQNAYRSFMLPSSRVDYRSVGDGRGSSIVMACLNWIARTFPEAPLALYEEMEHGQEEQRRGHPLLRLLQHPNDFYTGTELWMPTLVDWNVDGNAYWLKLRDKTGRVSQLWWVPHWMIEPRGSSSAYITHYDYYVYGTGQPSIVQIAPRDVVHFRFGLDSDDPKKGYSPLKSVLREVFTDDEAANFTAALLRNQGVPGLIVSPEKGSTVASPEAATATRQALQEMFVGDRRGEPLVMRGPTKVEQFGFNPQELVLRELRLIPEERVTAVLNVPAIVAGLGAGLTRSTFTNYSEARTAAYEQNIIPTQRILGEVIRFQLLTEFQKDPFQWRVGFDLREVRTLADAEERRVRRLIAEFNGGISTRAYVLRALGRKVEPGGADDVYLQPLHSVLLPAGESFVNPAEATSRTPDDQTAPPAPTLPPAKANGNGHDAHLAAAIHAEVARQLQTQGS